MSVAGGFRGIVAVALLLTFVSTATAKYSGGTGEPNDPYQIATAADLMALGETPEDYDKHFLLTADIDLDPNLPGRKVFDKAVVGAGGRGFSGVFHGDGHTISNIVVSGGLFGYAGRSSKIENLCIRNANVMGDDGVGGLVRSNEGSLIACCVSGSVKGNGDRIGGLAGSNLLGSVTACFATASVSGHGHVGGLIGDNTHGSLTSCYASGAVNGRSSVGGLVGKADGIGNLTACYAAGSVRGDTLVGGLVGSSHFMYAGVIACFWDVETSGQAESVGGKGLSTRETKSLVVLQNAGWAEKGWVIDNGQDYPRLAWQGTAGVPIPEAELVPLKGSGTAEEPYEVWTPSDFALLSWHSSILDKHIVLMDDVNVAEVTLDPIGDLGPFTGVFDGRNHAIRNATIEQPATDHVGLFGCVAQNGLICSVHAENIVIVGRDCVGGLAGFSDRAAPSIWGYPSDGLMACHVAGSIAGRSFVGGLAGYSKYASIHACSAAGSVSGDGSYIGGLIGSGSWDDLIECCSSADVTGSGGVGGLVGTDDFGTLACCFTTGSTSGHSGVGGLVGANAGDIRNCHSTGPVSGGSEVGGLIGLQGPPPLDKEESVRNCYATGPVGGDLHVGGLIGSTLSNKISGCFWDVETSGQTVSAGGTGKTTAEMQTAQTFLDAGWDFIGEVANGTEDIWWIDEGRDYPRLWWEASEN